MQTPRPLAVNCQLKTVQIIMMRSFPCLLAGLTCCVLNSGCSPESSATQTGSSAETTPGPTDEEKPAADVPEQSGPDVTESRPAVRRGPVTLGGGSSQPADTDARAGSRKLTAEQQTQTVFEALKPLQILMGSWEGKTRKQFDGFSAVDDPKWVWDFLTDRQRPALVMESDQSPYFKKLRMTYDPEAGRYRLTAEHEDYGKREYAGEFIQEIKDVPGDDDKLQRTYKLQFTQVEPADSVEQWQIVINQQDNNRYLMDMSRKRGTSDFHQLDTVAMQREGTSFALSDTDYGEKTCIVSGGLGTAMVSYKGRTYYVCCSGCSAAFNEDPERWIAKALEEAKE